MLRTAIASGCFLLALAAAGLADEGELIQSALDDAVVRFDKTVQRLSDELIEEFDHAIDSARKKAARDSDEAKLFDWLKAAKDRFSSSGTLPPPEVLDKPVVDFERDLASAREDVEKAFDKAIAAALNLKLDSLAGRIKEQRMTFDATFAKQHPVRIVASWLHIVGRTGRYRFEFASDGRILSPAAGERSWQIVGRTLILRTKAPKAPGGEWVDKCRLSPDGKSYKGRNQDGTEIQGTKLELP